MIHKFVLYTNAQFEKNEAGKVENSSVIRIINHIISELNKDISENNKKGEAEKIENIVISDLHTIGTNLIIFNLKIEEDRVDDFIDLISEYLSINIPKMSHSISQIAYSEKWEFLHREFNQI